MAIYISVVMYGLKLFIVVLQEVQYVNFLFHGRYGYLAVRKVLFLNSKYVPVYIH